MRCALTMRMEAEWADLMPTTLGGGRGRYGEGKPKSFGAMAGGIAICSCMASDAALLSLLRAEGEARSEVFP